MNSVLTVADARKTFGGTRALDGANLHLNPGECLALLGPNGAGKTTLIRAIAGRAILDQGSITLLGATLNGSAPRSAEARLSLGLVPQEIALYPLLTARENLVMFGRLSGVAPSELTDRVNWALDWTGLAERAASLSKTFSGGMKRRLNIACSVLHSPKVILLDEPTVGVDPQSRQRIWEMLAALRDAGASLLLTTHQLDEAQQVCDRITIIDHGKTIADGTMDELLAATIGRDRTVTLMLDSPVEQAAIGTTATVIGSSVRVRTADVASTLPGVLDRIQRAGRIVQDIQVHTPTLHAVFLHLTGRELRE